MSIPGQTSGVTWAGGQGEHYQKIFGYPLLRKFLGIRGASLSETLCIVSNCYLLFHFEFLNLNVCILGIAPVFPSCLLRRGISLKIFGYQHLIKVFTPPPAVSSTYSSCCCSCCCCCSCGHLTSKCSRAFNTS